MPDIHHVLGHVGIFRALVDAAQIDSETEARLFDAVQRKAYDEISEVLNASVASDSLPGPTHETYPIERRRKCARRGAGRFCLCP